MESFTVNGSQSSLLKIQAVRRINAQKVDFRYQQLNWGQKKKRMIKRVSNAWNKQPFYFLKMLSNLKAYTLKLENIIVTGHHMPEGQCSTTAQ